MGDVHNILEASPHMSGPAVCLACGHQWTAVAPTGVDCLECPGCHTHRGVYDYHPTPGGFMYQCNCGCSAFSIDPQAMAMCLHCGTRHTIEPMQGPRIA